MSENQISMGQGLDRWLNLSIICIVVAAMFFDVSKTVADCDLWGHVKFGQDFLASFKVPTTDPYSYVTAGAMWIDDEWLSEAIFAFFFNHWGASGLVAVKLIVVMTIIAILYTFLLRAGFNTLRAGLFIVLTMQLIGPGLATVRPQLFTYLFFLITLLVILKSDQQKYNWLWLLPAVFALWANLHPGFVAGLAVLATWGVLHIGTLMLNHKRSNIALIAGALILTALSTLINPYGYQLLTFLAETVPGNRPEITEWAAIPIASLAGVIYLFFVVIGALGFINSKEKPSKTIISIWCLLCTAPLVAYRHLPLFALATVILAGPSICNWWKQNSRIQWSDEFSKYSPLMKRAIICLFLGGSIFLLARSTTEFGRLKIQDYFPIPVMELLKQADAQGNIANDFDCGQYLIYHLGPKVKVSMDGRRDTVYSKPVYMASFDFTTGAGNWDAVLKNYPTDLVLANSYNATLNLMKLQPDWLLIYEDKYCGLFVKKGSPLAQKLKDAKPPNIPARPWYFP